MQPQIKQGCSIDFGASSVIDFGIFTALDRPTDKYGSFILRCSEGKGGGKKVRIFLDAGAVNPSDTADKRKLYLSGAAGDGFIMYQVFQGSGDSEIWGGGAHGTQPYGAVSRAQAKTFIILRFSCISKLFTLCRSANIAISLLFR